MKKRTAALLEAAHETQARIGDIVRGTWPDRERTGQANAFLAFAMVSMEHARAILVLTESGLALRLSAMALIRPMIETLARALWARTATDEEIAQVGNFRDASDAALQLFSKKGSQKMLDRLGEHERNAVIGIQDVLGKRSDDEVMENGVPQWLTRWELYNRAVHGNACVSRAIMSPDGFGSENVPEEFGSEVLRWATDWMLVTIALMLDSLRVGPEPSKQLLEIADTWKRALEKYHSEEKAVGAADTNREKEQ